MRLGRVQDKGLLLCQVLLPPDGGEKKEADEGASHHRQKDADGRGVGIYRAL